MSTIVVQHPTESKNLKVNLGKLAALKQQRAQIQSEIAKLTRSYKNNPERKAEGKVYYLHSKFRPGFSRLTIAAHVNEAKQEMYFGVSICNPFDQFVKKTGRVKAMGRAVSTNRQIVKLKKFDHAYVREKLSIYLKRYEINAYQNDVYKYPTLSDNSYRVSVAQSIGAINDYEQRQNGTNKG